MTPDFFEDLSSLYQVKKMTTHEKRKNPRIDSPNLLSYVCLDENNQIMKQGMGRTLNVSEGGILLETHVPMDSQHTVSLTIGLEDDLMDFKGKIGHCKQREDGKFESGIEFIETDETKLRFFKQFMLIFKGQEIE
jgi:hypothetical protein